MFTFGSRPRTGPLRTLRALLAASALTVVLTPAAAEAKPYEVWACQTPGGAGAIAFSEFPFMRSNISTQTSNMDDYCANPAMGGSATFTASGPLQGSPAEARYGWTFTKPEHTTIQAFHHRAQVTYGAGDQWGAMPLEVDVDGGAQMLNLATYHGSQPLTWRSETVPNTARTLRYIVVCRAAGSCSADNHRLTIDALRMQLDDPSAPTTGTPTGAITAGGGYKSGSIGLSANVSDNGSGVYRTHLTVDGVIAKSQAVSDNGGACAVMPNTGPGNGWAYRGFSSKVPCALFGSTTLSLNTTSLTDGVHSVTFSVEDAAGNVRDVDTYSVRVNNPAGALPDTVCTDGLDNDGDGSADLGTDAGCLSAADTAETENPVNTAAPAVTGATRIGSSVAGFPGAWNDGPGTGGTSSRRWQACRYDGEACVELPGATGPTLTLTDELIGRRIRVVETRVTSEGAASQPSSRTAVVTAVDGSLPACADGIDNDRDGLIDRDADGGCTSRNDRSEDALGGDEDFDGDGIPNSHDPDDDGDGVNDDVDPAPYDPAIDGRTNGAPGGGGTTVIVTPGPTNAPTSNTTTGNTTNTTVVAPATNGANASERAVVTVTGARTRTVGHGRRAIMVARLTDEHGMPISGAVLSIQELTFIPKAGPMKGAAWRTVILAKPLVTDGNGRFRYVIAPGHSRIVRVGYKARTADRDFTATTDLTLLVRSRATLTVSRKVVRNGRSVAFSGRLLGGQVPATGVTVVLQARTQRGWVTFATTRAKRTGRFSAAYRFHATTGTQRYRFRAVVKADSGYPWLPSVSRTAAVTVRG